jgi:regulator of cell morphogenesis and NO signaling
MGTIFLDKTLGQLVTERPARAHLFERLGLDYCCGGGKRLADAARGAGLDPSAVLRELDTWDAHSSGEENVDWSKATMTELADHIVAAHHGYLRDRLPTLAVMLEKVLRAHGQSHPELLELRQLFASLWAELDCHMVKEEEVLFPICRAMDRRDAMAHAGVPVAPMSLHGPIGVMIQEHEDAGDALATMRALTQGYTPPEDACATYRALLAGLAELEADLHQHIHKENNILFPKAIAAEEAPSPGRGA